MWGLETTAPNLAAGFSGFETTVAATLDNAIIHIIRNEGFDPEGKDRYVITAKNTKGKAVTFEISNTDYERVFKDRFESSPELTRFNEYKKIIMANNILNKDKDLLMTENFNTGEVIGTTSKDGKATTVGNATLQQFDFPNVRLFGISGNLVTEDGLYFDLEVNIRDPFSGKWVEGVEFINENRTNSENKK